MSLIKATYIAPETNDSINIFLVLYGRVSIIVLGKKYDMVRDDLLLVNPLQQYEIEGSKKNVFLHLRIYKEQINQYFTNTGVPFFECSTVEAEGNEYEKFKKMRKILAHLMAIYFKQTEGFKLEVYKHLFTLLTHLVKEFKNEIRVYPTINTSTVDERISIILGKIQTEYNQVLLLGELAEESEISYYYLSRTFKKQVGHTFTEYLTKIRLSHATEEIIATNHSIINVALNNGFPNTQKFHQVFKKHYGITPTVYRKDNSRVYKQQTISSSTINSDYQELTGVLALKELAKYLVENDIEDIDVGTEQKLTLSVKKEVPLEAFHQGKKIVKIGSANEGLSAGIQKQIEIVSFVTLFQPEIVSRIQCSI